MHPLMIGDLDPAGELAVDLLKTRDLVAGDREGAFKTALDGLDHPFDLPLAPRGIGVSP